MFFNFEFMFIIKYSLFGYVSLGLWFWILSKRFRFSLFLWKLFAFFLNIVLGFSQSQFACPCFLLNYFIPPPPWFLDLHVETVCSANKHKIRNWLQWHGPGSVFQFSLFKYYKFLACLMFMLTLVFVPLTQCSYPLSSCLGFIPLFVSSPVHLVFSCDCFPPSVISLPVLFW